MPVQEEIAGRGFERQTLEKIGLLLLVSAEVAAVLFCGWQLFILRGWQRADPSALRTSPDASYLYLSALANVEMARGLLLGLLGAALATAAISFWSAGPKAALFARMFFALAVAIPLIALLALRV
ncbi:MAG: hypothetical protein ACREP9_04045 [Candidatus Dormibacteraceae bacterium]